jgi:hypothetical protein
MTSVCGTIDVEPQFVTRRELTDSFGLGDKEPPLDGDGNESRPCCLQNEVSG